MLVTRPVEAEAGLAFTGLADIARTSSTDVAPALPTPQLTALRVALLLDEADGAPPDERAVGAALRSVLSEAARRGPTLLAIDDVQWLDGASARALAFALRRVREAPPRVLLAQRSAPDAEPPPGLGRADVEVEQVAIGALDAEALHEVVVQARGRRYRAQHGAGSMRSRAATCSSRSSSRDHSRRTAIATSGRPCRSRHGSATSCAAGSPLSQAAPTYSPS